MSDVSKQEHVFISYSHVDQAFVDRLTTDLTREGVRIWIDRDLQPGTPNWDVAVRNAIERSYAVLLIASSHSMGSHAVLGEIAVARAKNRPIYPIWVSGTEWTDSVPIPLINSQYLDCRGSRYEANIPSLIRLLRRDPLLTTFISGEAITKPAVSQTAQPVQMSVENAVDAEIFIRKEEANGEGNDNSVLRIPYRLGDQMSSLLDYLWLKGLSTTYRAYTYGTDWVLASDNEGPVRRLLLPWMWPELGTSVQRDRDLYYQWARRSAAGYGFTSGTCWRILDLKQRNISMIRVATNNRVLHTCALALSRPTSSMAASASSTMTWLVTSVFDTVIVRYHGLYVGEQGEVRFLSPHEQLAPEYLYTYIFTAPQSKYHDAILLFRTTRDDLDPDTFHLPPR